MKNLIILIIALFACSNANAQWTLLNPAPTSNDLYSVYFPDVNTGYVVGERGTILKTTDGGTLWTYLNSGTSKNLNSVSFTDLNTGYVVGDSGCILKTINGGSTWIPQSSGTSFSLRSVHFPVDGIGYAVGDSMMLSTKNGGVTWTGKSLADGLLNFRLNFVYFVNADTGFATASKGWVYQGMVYKTTNGGLDWTICLPMWGWEFGYLGSMSFTDANTGYIAGWSGMIGFVSIVKTTDGGLTWSNYSCGMLNPCAIYFPSAGTGYIIGHERIFGYGAIQKTTDGGITWSEILIVTSNIVHLSSVCFPDNETGYIVGENGTILKITKGSNPFEIGEQTLTQKTFRIYPNPANSNIAIEIPGISTKSRLSISDLNGKELITRQIYQPKIQFNVSDLPKGVYLLRITNERMVGVQKIVKY